MTKKEAIAAARKRAALCFNPEHARVLVEEAARGAAEKGAAEREFQAYRKERKDIAR